DFIEIKKLGDGGFGTVYQAYNILDKNTYAIKIIDLEKTLEFHTSEAITFSKLNHPNIVRYFSTWTDIPSNKLFIQMELCNKTLAQYLADRNYEGNNTNFENEQNMFEQLKSALQYIHDHNIVHNDLNPNNIFLDSELNIKIGDFGLSCE